MKAGEIGWTEVRIDTPPNADGWCFCTPRHHPNDIARGLVEDEFNDRDQFFAKVVVAPVVQVNEQGGT